MSENQNQNQNLNENSTDINIILKNMLNFLKIKYNNIEDLVGKEIDRDDLLTKNIIEYYQTFQHDLKLGGFSTGKLTSLHKNNLVKQKFPAINMLRQVLKCKKLWLKPKVESKGYNKKTGKKFVKRSFIISLFEEKEQNEKDEDKQNKK
jgi:hypothetical protein